MSAPTDEVAVFGARAYRPSSVIAAADEEAADTPASASAALSASAETVPGRASRSGVAMALDPPDVPPTADIPLAEINNADGLLEFIRVVGMTASANGLDDNMLPLPCSAVVAAG